MNAFSVVKQFEDSVAEYTGATYAIAVSSGTDALFLCMQYRMQIPLVSRKVYIPAHTFLSVPMAIMQCGLTPEFHEIAWKGSYELAPLQIYDSALRFNRGMNEHRHFFDLECISFQARKILNIGEGGMILTRDKQAYDWLMAARYWGRKPPLYRVEDVSSVGWQMYMTPEKAARGLHLMEYIKLGQLDRQQFEDVPHNYPDLRPVFERIMNNDRAVIS